MNKTLIKYLKNINKNIIKLNVPLKNYNTLKLESYAKYFITPHTFMELKKTIEILRKFSVKYYILGNGSNIILSRKEKECIIKLNFIKNNSINVMNCNDLLMVKANEFLKQGYSGFEYISNIPASVGGAILMNAGAYGHNFSDIIEYVYYLDRDLKFKVINKEDCEFSYRSSAFKDSNKIIVGCKVKLLKGDIEEMKTVMKKCTKKRKETQPIEVPNCGSIFKNGEKYFAAQLIESLGLKGYKYNNAKISSKHSNFIVNEENANFEDIMYLISLIKKEVKKAYNVILKEEVIVID